jgi:4'-phosphopantetheinyl transferase
MYIHPGKNANMPARVRYTNKQSMTDEFPEIIQFSASAPPLVPAQLQLMVASLDDLARHQERAIAVIDSEEQARADRFINPSHGDNYRLVRGTLRLCLADYLGLPAESIRFITNQYGKPEVAPEQNQSAVHFNLSHSHRMAAFSFTLGQGVGVDIEFIKPLKNMAGLAKHVCSPMEMEEFLALNPAQQQDGFFRLWTRKEAFIKAKGQGLSMGLRSIYIGFDTTRSLHPVQYRGEWLNHWLVKDLHCDAGYKLAVSIETNR